MAKKKAPATKLPKGKRKSPILAVTSFTPEFTVNVAVDIKVFGVNFTNPVIVAINEITNTDVSWFLPTTTIIPDSSNQLTIVGAKPIPTATFPGAGEGDLTISVKSNVANAPPGITTVHVFYTD